MIRRASARHWSSGSHVDPAESERRVTDGRVPRNRRHVDWWRFTFSTIHRVHLDETRKNHSLVKRMDTVKPYAVAICGNFDPNGIGKPSDSEHIHLTIMRASPRPDNKLRGSVVHNAAISCGSPGGGIDASTTGSADNEPKFMTCEQFRDIDCQRTCTNMNMVVDSANPPTCTDGSFPLGPTKCFCAPAGVKK